MFAFLGLTALVTVLWLLFAAFIGYLIFEVEVIPEPKTKTHVWLLCWAFLPVLLWLFLVNRDDGDPNLWQLLVFLFTMKDTVDGDFAGPYSDA